MALLLCLLGVVFRKGKRKKALAASAVALVVTLGSLVAFGAANDSDARALGFLDNVDRMHAKEAGYTDPGAWAGVREAHQAASRVDANVAAVAHAGTTQALDAIVAYVAEVTHNLPSSFRDHGNMIPEEVRMQPLADDVLAYARFYWTVDSIENNCQFLGQRTNIQILAPDNGVTSWVATASTAPKHPNYAEYFGIFEKFEAAVTELGEATVCPAMYRLLGPNGSLMEDALDINGLIDPEELNMWEVRVEDGVLWSSRDYCERRYYLEHEPQQPLHDQVCNQAKSQDF